MSELTQNSVKANVKYVSLQEITTKIGSGATPTGGKESYKDHGISLIRSLNVYDFSFKYQDLAFIDENQARKLGNVEVEPKDILLNITGASVGRCTFVPKQILPARVNQHVSIIRLNPEIADSLYVLYTINSRHFKSSLLNLSQTGATREALTKEDICGFKIPIPPLPTQRKIAAVLSAYDDLIENNDRRIALLEKMAEEIYREWFVRLRFPEHEQVTFHKGIPEDWEKKRFDEFCLLQRGYDLPDDKVKPGIYPVIASTSIKTYHAEFKVRPPVITTGRSGSLGTVLFVNGLAWPLNTALFVKSFFGNSPYLIYYTLKFLKLENFNAGAGVPSLNRNHLGGLYMSVPPKSLQNKFDEQISVLFQQKENLKKSNETLKQTRDRLLTRLISGKLSVEDLDIQLPPSMTADS